MNHRGTLTLLALLLAVCTAGCSIMPFEDPAEQRAQEQSAAAVKTADVLIDPADLLGDDLKLTQELKNDAGQVLATYSARLPHFTVDEAKKGQSFQRIDDYYSEQLTALQEDCDSFFAMVKEHYGANWAAAAVAQTVFSAELTYALTDAPEGYLCVMSTYTMVSDGASEVYRDAEVFLLDSGWRLTLAELFGSHYEEAQPLLLQGIRDWCAANGMSADKTALLALDDFAQSYGMDGDSLLFFLPPFTLSTTDDEARIIRLWLGDYADLLPENVTTDSAAPAKNDSPAGAA